MKSTDEPQAWDPKAVVDRVNRARGNYLARTGEELEWADFGARLGWKPSTVTDVKSGERPLRVAELGVMAQMLGVRPGYLAFSDGTMELPATTAAPIPMEIEHEVEQPVRPSKAAPPSKRRPPESGARQRAQRAAPPQGSPRRRHGHQERES